ncbi:MAG: metal-sensitive transcriptional regulator [Patescibacteria group bacterium]
MQKPVITRLNRAKGQIDGLIRLIESESDCQKVAEQFSAADAALKRAVEVYLRDHLDSCLGESDPKTKKEMESIMGALFKRK